MSQRLSDLLLTPAEMAAADRAAAESGIDSYGLMEKAGAAVAATALRLYPGAVRFAVLCGPGNNGGDGYVVARLLQESGAHVEIFHLGDPEKLKGDAARARAACALKGLDIGNYDPQQGDIVIDGLFGAGLTRSVPSDVAELIQKVEKARIAVIAVDLPSGLDGRTGAVLGAAFRAAHTVTFMTRKPGHLLMPGRELCGSLEVFDIGIPSRIISAQTDGRVDENTPAAWRAVIPTEQMETHKYKRVSICR